MAVRPVSPVCLAFLLAALAVLPGAARADAPSLLADLYAAAQPDPDSLLQPLGGLDDGRTVFTAADHRHGREPWVSDGTAAGTFLLGDLCPGACSGVPEGRGLSVGRRVFFLVGADVVAAERQLWVTDGTAAGTHPLPVEVVAWLAPRMQGDGTGRLFLLGRRVSGEDVLWVSDGTAAGTRRLPHPVVPGGTPGVFGGRLGQGRVWFVAGTGVGGTQEPWVSDGTAAGTRRLVRGPAVAGPTLQDPFSPAFTLVPLDDGGGVMLQNLGPEPGFEGERAVAVWESDGTPEGTRRTRVLDREWLSSVSSLSGPRAAFVTQRDDGVQRLWTSDGSAAGTEMVRASADGLFPGVWSEGRLYFFHFAAELEGGWELWSHAPGRDDERLGTFCREFCSAGGRPVPFAGGVAFVAGGRSQHELWTSDGTAAGTRRAAVLCEECGSESSILAVAGGQRLFVAVGREVAWELLVSDGTPEGTVPLAPAPFAGPGPGDAVAAVAGGLLVSADDGTHGREPWVSDGTPGGTRLLANLAPPVGNGDSLPRGLTPWGERVLFFARDPTGWGVWVSDGTGAGTRRLHRLANSAVIDSDLVNFSPRPLLLAGDLFFFVQPVEDRRSGDLKVVDLAAGQLRHLGRFPISVGPAVGLGDGLLWSAGENRLVVSDGTLEGTGFLPGVRLQFGGPLASFGPDAALFSGFRPDPDGGPGSAFGLWRTDGTVAGTRRVFLTADPFSMPHALTVISPELVVFARHRDDDAARHIELWRGDGTADGNLPLTTFSEPQGTVELQGPFELTAVGDEALFFISRQGLELWRTDGTPARTRPVVRPHTQGEPLRFVSAAVPFAGGLFFVGSDLWAGTEPWVTDGTAAGTHLVADLLPGERSSIPRELTVRDDGLFLVAADGDERLRLWRSDGTAAGTVALDDPASPVRSALEPELALAGGRLIYSAETLDLGNELWTLPVDGAPEPVPGPPTTPPPAPRELAVGVTDDGVVVLTWLAPSSQLNAYLVEARTPAAAEFRTVARERGQFPSSVLQELPPGVPHTFRVRAVNAAGVSAPSGEVSATPRAGPVTPCVPAADHLCLLDGRFRVTVSWRDPRSGRHGGGVARPIPGSDRSGTFWFFRDANVELIVKTLDGTFVNRRWWVFAGGLTDVEYWIGVDDSSSGETKTYHSADRDLCGFADTAAFAGEPADSFPLPAAGRVSARQAGEPLDLVDGRFRVEVEWSDQHSGDTGAGHGLPWSVNTGFFWFFHPENVELVVKVLDGRPVNGRWWVFHGGLTDVGYSVRVTDLASGAVRTYEHPAGDLCGGSDTGAFEDP